jgi:hypothetical protein
MQNPDILPLHFYRKVPPSEQADTGGKDGYWTTAYMLEGDEQEEDMRACFHDQCAKDNITLVIWVFTNVSNWGAIGEDLLLCNGETQIMHEWSSVHFKSYKKEYAFDKIIHFNDFTSFVNRVNQENIAEVIAQFPMEIRRRKILIYSQGVSCYFALHISEETKTWFEKNNLKNMYDFFYEWIYRER